MFAAEGGTSHIGETEELLSSVLVFQSTGERLDQLSHERMIELLSIDLLDLEHHYLREPNGKPQKTPEAVLQFLCSPTGDVTEAENFDGSRVYDRDLVSERTKTGEIEEARVQANVYFDEMEELTKDFVETYYPDEFLAFKQETSKETKVSIKQRWEARIRSVIQSFVDPGIDVMEASGDLNRDIEIIKWWSEYVYPELVHYYTEVSDVVFNLVQLTRLDKTDRTRYEIYLNKIAHALGVGLDDMLQIALLKYNFRYGLGKSIKDPHKEDAIVSLWIQKHFEDRDHLHYLPTNGQVRAANQELKIINNLLTQRLEDSLPYELGIQNHKK